MTGLISDERVTNAMQATEIFIKNFSKLIGVFFEYPGSDFCAGFLYGQAGA